MKKIDTIKVPAGIDPWAQPAKSDGSESRPLNQSRMQHFAQNKEDFGMFSQNPPVTCMFCNSNTYPEMKNIVS